MTRVVRSFHCGRRSVSEANSANRSRRTGAVGIAFETNLPPEQRTDRAACSGGGSQRKTSVNTASAAKAYERPERVHRVIDLRRSDTLLDEDSEGFEAL